MNRKIDILCFNSIEAINGPVIIHRSILKFNDIFTDRGYDVSIIFKEGIYKKEYIFSDVDQVRGYNRKLKIKDYCKTKIISFYRSIGFLNTMSYYYFDFSLKRKVKKYLKLDRNPEVIVTDSEREMYHFLKSNAKSTKTVLFMHTDGIPMKMISLANPEIENTFFYQKMARRYIYTIDRVDKIVFICNIGKQNFLKSYPDFDRSKLSVVLNGIEGNGSKMVHNLLPKSEYEYNLTCVGSLSFRKGQEIIIKALALSNRDSLEKIHVNIIGDGPARKEIENLIKFYKLDSYVTLLGSIDNSLVRQQLMRSDIFILTSRNEGLPISIIEAMREGLAIISTGISGIPELVENKYNGVLIDPSVEQLKDVFNNMDSYNWKVMGKNSLKLFREKFTLDRVFSEYCDIYDSLVK